MTFNNWYFTFVKGNLVLRNKRLFSLSNTQAEYKIVVKSIQELLWFKTAYEESWFSSEKSYEVVLRSSIIYKNGR
jgi:hypothetical protein